MMTVLLFLATVQVAASPTLPIDWSALAPLPFATTPQITPPLTRFVADEIASGRCTFPTAIAGRRVVTVEVATLVDADGSVRRTVPRAIDCPTVEQYSAGLVVNFARENLTLRAGAPRQRWYRATIVFDLAG